MTTLHRKAEEAHLQQISLPWDPSSLGSPERVRHRLSNNSNEDTGAVDCMLEDRLPPHCQFDRLDRAGAERLLKDKEGTYLIREGSAKIKVLSVWQGRRCNHYKIFQDDFGNVFLVRQQHFGNLVELLKYYTLQAHLPQTEHCLWRPFHPECRASTLAKNYGMHTSQKSSLTISTLLPGPLHAPKLNVGWSAPELLDEKCCYSGWIRKQGGGHKNWKRRYLILRAGCLYYFSNETASAPKGKFVLSGYHVADCHESKKFNHVLKLEPLNPHIRTYYIACNTRRELERWKYELEEEINSINHLSIRRMSKTSSMSSLLSASPQRSTTRIRHTTPPPVIQPRQLSPPASMNPLSTPHQLTPPQAPALSRLRHTTLPPTRIEHANTAHKSLTIARTLKRSPRIEPHENSPLDENRPPRPPRSFIPPTESVPSTEFRPRHESVHVYEEIDYNSSEEDSYEEITQPADYLEPQMYIDPALLQPIDGHYTRVLGEDSDEMDGYSQVDLNENGAPVIPNASTQPQYHQLQGDRETSPSQENQYLRVIDSNVDIVPPADTPKRTEMPNQGALCRDSSTDSADYYIMFPTPEEALPPSCVFEQLSRPEADKLLREKNEEGTYLIRRGSLKAGSDKVLTVWHDSHCRHYKLFIQNNKFMLTGSQSFGTLPALIQHYRLQAYLPQSEFYLRLPYKHQLT